MSVATVESLTFDEKQWRTIRKGLEDIGISVAAFDANKAFIMEWFQHALDSGAFDGQAPNDVWRYREVAVYGDATNVQAYHGMFQAPFLSGIEKKIMTYLPKYNHRQLSQPRAKKQDLSDRNGVPDEDFICWASLIVESIWPSSNSSSGSGIVPLQAFIQA
ncbi:uncharacterized protein K444DRAFT_623197 [Hyaloscypha bicolor E]|uniref:Uncharacterized protein n=1 Tax=Hyaloscypha bicolor E TaxID=1095630 RepID=A0A2J6TV95_9HELO|nr:uncharacterized protein K444DRAFT_623197 [Hyaloscypha bicolor E]PMD66949.1 hypothetical protein K444DRAFT_623197 [Hyaloscypha bicolor E]